MNPQALLSRRRLLELGLSLPLAAPLGLASAQTAPGALATLKGQVRFEGKAPTPARLTLTGDCAYCRRFDLRSEDLLVSKSGGLRNVVAALTVGGRIPGTPVAPDAAKPQDETSPVAELREERCTFVPHVMSLTAGQALLLHNLDPVLNTFHAVARPSGRTLFNIGLPQKGQQVRRRLREPGLIQMLCDVHPWERATIAVFDHPHHAVTDADGHFTLAGLPPGTHTLSLWHETLGTKRLQVTLAPGQTLAVQAAFRPIPF